MIIVKLTILLLVITAIWIFVARTWADGHPAEVLLSQYPHWMCIVTACIVIADIIGILSSTVWFLFIRQAGGVYENYITKWND